MLVKFLNSDSTVSTAIAGSYFKGDGWTGAYYDSGTGQLVFESDNPFSSNYMFFYKSLNAASNS